MSPDQRSYYHDVQLACSHILRTVLNSLQNRIQMVSPNQVETELHEVAAEEGPKRDPIDPIPVDRTGIEGEEGEDDDEDEGPVFGWNSRGPLTSNVKASTQVQSAKTASKSSGSSSKTVKPPQTTGPASSPTEPMSRAKDTVDSTISEQSTVVGEDKTKVEDEKQEAANEKADDEELPKFPWNFRGKIGSNVQGNNKAKAVADAQKEKEKLKAAKAQDPKAASADPKKPRKT